MHDDTTRRRAPAPARRIVGALIAAAACTAATLAAAVDSTAAVFASGLNNPRGMAFGPDGARWIAETGTLGGAGPSTVVRGATLTYSPSASITRADGRLLVLAYDTNGLFAPGGTGRLSRLAGDGSVSLVYDDLVGTTALAVGPDGGYCVTQFGAGDGLGARLHHR